MLYLWIFLMILGFVLLIKGADWFVDGAAGIAEKCNVSPLVIGLTVIAFGTSAPELCVSVASAVQRLPDFSTGNVIGSNIANILLILGCSALFRPLPVQKNSLRLDIPVLLLASFLLIGLGIWGRALEWWDGLIFLAVFAVYMFLLFRNAKRAPASSEAPAAPKEEPKKGFGAWLDRMKEKLWFLILLTLVGLGMVVGGGTLLVDGAKYIAEFFGAPQDVIGLTVIAIGTSLPELVTSVVAAAKGETDIAVGNIIGSNIFNILFVAGIASLFYPLAFDLNDTLIDALAALLAALVLYLCAFLGKEKIGRASGAVMLLMFAAYYVYLFAVRI